jgi:hypothetical protein
MHDQCQDDDQDQIEEFSLIGHKSPPVKNGTSSNGRKNEIAQSACQGSRIRDCVGNSISLDFEDQA